MTMHKQTGKSGPRAWQARRPSETSSLAQSTNSLPMEKARSRLVTGTRLPMVMLKGSGLDPSSAVIWRW